MRFTKRITALALTVITVFTLLAATATTARAIEGAGLPSSTVANVAHGIDISKWNFGTNYDMIDFARAKADGCDFVILRIGTGYGGDNNLDVSFVQHYKNARAAGMPMGLYFYSYGTTYAEAKEDAEWVMSVIEENGMYFEYPLYYDTEEDDQEALSDANYVNFCLGWCDTLAANGYYPGVYGTASALDKLSSSFNAKYDRWYARVKTAEHTGSSSNQYNTTDRNYSTYASMWQYAWYDYTYDGITFSSSTSGLDVDVAYKDYPSIMEKYGYNNVPSNALDDAIEAALDADYTLYTAEQIEEIRAVYAEAKALNNSSSATSAQKTAKAEELMKALETVASANESVVSRGKSYTTTAPNRPDGDNIDWDDDGARLTDGSKGATNVNTNGYAAWTNGVTVDIVIDLGCSQLSNIFRVYAAGGDWGAEAPSAFSVSYSADGTEFTEIATTQHRARVATGSPWVSYCYSYTADAAVNARYIKLSVTPNGTHTWLDEVEVVYDPNPALSGCIKIDGINGYITSGITYLFTPAFGTVTTAKANHAWTRNVVAKWSAEDNAYTVTSVTVGNGTTTTPDITLASDEILIAAHNWETDITDGTAVAGSELNVENLATLNVGDLITLNGIDVANQTHHVIPYIVPTFAEPEPEISAIASVGAAANSNIGGLRFAAKYTKLDGDNDVTAIGFLLIIKDGLGSSTLDLNYKSDLLIADFVQDITVCGVIDPVPGKAFEDYDELTFYATLTGIGAIASVDYAAVPYVTYEDGTTLYGEMMVNSISGVLAGESSFN